MYLKQIIPTKPQLRELKTKPTDNHKAKEKNYNKSSTIQWMKLPLILKKLKRGNFAFNYHQEWIFTLSTMSIMVACLCLKCLTFRSLQINQIAWSLSFHIFGKGVRPQNWIVLLPKVEHRLSIVIGAKIDFEWAK